MKKSNHLKHTGWLKCIRAICGWGLYVNFSLFDESKRIIKAYVPDGEKNGLRNLGNKQHLRVSSIYRDLKIIWSLFVGWISYNCIILEFCARFPETIDKHVSQYQTTW